MATDLTLHFHPLSSFSQKAVIALYENAIDFTPQFVDFGDEASATAHRGLWPIGKIPVLRDEARDRTVPEATIIIEYLALHHPGPVELVPADPEQACEVRLKDRFFDLYVNTPMQKVVTDRLRPEASRDPFGVEEARRLLATACAMIDGEMAARTWAMGEAFTMADCAAAPALAYADMVMPLGSDHPNAAAYLDRLKQRPSFARALTEAEPYLGLVPS